MRNLFAIFLCFFLTMNANAYPWVEVNKLETVSGSSLKAITFTYSWPFEEQNTEIAECKSGCLIAPFFEGGTIHNIETTQKIIIAASDSCYELKCIWEKWVANHGAGVNVASWQTGQAGAVSGCWTFLVFPYSSGSSVSGSGVRLTGARCAFAPPEAVSCSIDTLADFDHGTLSSKEVDGSVSVQQGNLNCSSDAKVDIYMAYGDKIQLGDTGITSEITINGNVANSTNPITVDAKQGNNNLSIQSYLNADTEITGGEYIGSNILIMNIY